ncbi:MAG: hypothetical protein JRI25_28755, partial [Deltaproteobacteria bacterium]|nr:hypothetical protein [Deltaproteobacteria bacterium]
MSFDLLRRFTPLLALLLVGCANPDEEPDLGPYPDWCREQTFDGTLTDATVGVLSGRYIGIYNGLPVGTLLTMKVIPEHPFQLTGIRVATNGSAGPIRVRLTESIGR